MIASICASWRPVTPSLSLMLLHSFQSLDNLSPGRKIIWVSESTINPRNSILQVGSQTHFCWFRMNPSDWRTDDIWLRCSFRPSLVCAITRISSRYMTKQTPFLLISTDILAIGGLWRFWVLWLGQTVETWTGSTGHPTQTWDICGASPKLELSGKHLSDLSFPCSHSPG